MKNIIALVLSGALAASSVSCTTTYDAYGNPHQSVDPRPAVAGAAAAGVLGYAIAKDRDDDRRYRYPQHRSGYHGHNGHNSYHRR